MEATVFPDWDWDDKIFLCQFLRGGEDSVDPVYKIIEYEDRIEVYGGCMIPEMDCYVFYKEDLFWWQIKDKNEY